MCVLFCIYSGICAYFVHFNHFPMFLFYEAFQLLATSMYVKFLSCLAFNIILYLVVKFLYQTQYNRVQHSAIQ